jgi:hypothetical protein
MAWLAWLESPVLENPVFNGIMASAWLVLGCVSAYAVREGKAGPGLLLIPVAFGSVYTLKLLCRCRCRWHRATRKDRRP